MVGHVPTLLVWITRPAAGFQVCSKSEFVHICIKEFLHAFVSG